MRYIKFFLSSLVAVLALSCVKEIKQEDNSLKNGFSEITASCAENEVKTVLGPDGTNVLWNPKDEISVFYNEIGLKFTSINSEPTACTVFTCDKELIYGRTENEASPYIYAAYPYSSSNSMKGEEITLTVPSSQTAVEGSFARGSFPSIGRSTTTDIAFYNVCGGMSFTLSQDGISKMIFQGNGEEIIAGKVKVKFNTDGLPEFVDTVGNAKANGTDFRSITLIAPDTSGFKKGKWYYVSMLPVSLSKGFSVNFFKGADESEQWTRKITTAVEVKRSIFGSINNIDADSPSITVNGEQAVELVFDNAASSQTVTIVSNRQWKLSDLSEKAKAWITVSGANGIQEATDGKEVSISVSANTGAARSYGLTFTNGTVNATVTVKQGFGPKSLPYSESFANGQGEFTIEDKKIPSGFNNVWYYSIYQSDKFMKASSYKSGAYASESWLVSPEINLAEAKPAELSFALVQANGVVSKYKESFYLKVISGTDTTKLNVSNPTSSSYNFVTQKVDLSTFAGKLVKIALVYVSDANQLGACTVEVKDFKVDFKPDPITTTKISDILAAEDGTDFTLTGATVAETAVNHFIVSDGSDFLLVHDTTAITIANNDIVTLKGQVSTYNSMKQAESHAITKTGTGSFVAPTPEDISSSFDSFTSSKVKYIKVAGKITIDASKGYANFAVTGANTNKGSLTIPGRLDYSQYNGKPVEIEGFYVYTAGTVYITVLPSKITLNNYIVLDANEARVAAADTKYSFKVSSNVSWSIATPAGCTAEGNYTNISGDSTVTYSFPANTDSLNSKVYTFTVADVNGVAAPAVLTLTQSKAGKVTYTYADFETLTASGSYRSGLETTKGWVINNAAVLTGGTTDSSPSFVFIGTSKSTGKYAFAPTINGKTSAVGTITSPSLTGGCGSLRFNYGFAFGESGAIKFKIEIKQSGTVIKTLTVDETGKTQKTAYEKEYDVNVSGTFQIVITNLSPSNSTNSNRDRYSIWDLGWSGYTK